MSDFKKLFPSFPNYTEDMYEGNKPKCESTAFCDSMEWHSKYGTAHISNDGIINSAYFSLYFKNPKYVVEIIGNNLTIRKYSSDNKSIYVYHSSRKYGEYFNKMENEISEYEIIRNVLSCKIDNCVLWNIIKERATYLFNESKEKYFQTLRESL